MPRLFAETVEEIASEEASIRNLFSGDGTRVREARGKTPRYAKQLLEASRFVEQVTSGRRPMAHLQEAMSTSDFPILFADILDRQMLGAYREITPVWESYIGTTTVPDFRPVSRRAVDGAEGPLPEVDELEEYPEARLQVAEDTFKVRKYGRRLDLSWETLINDDLDSFANAPQRLAKGARRSEQRFATRLYVDASGPRADLYTGPNNNIIPGNPEFSLDGLQAGLDHLATFSDVDDEPIVLDQVHLVVPPALEIKAQTILNATLLRLDMDGGQFETNNWIANRLKLHVDPYIPRIATTAHGSSSWWLFADPNDGRPFAQFARLRGYEDPGLYERMPNSRRVGGGGEVMEAFEDDSRAWKVRHVFGGGLLLETGGEKATAASNGSGS